MSSTKRDRSEYMREYRAKKGIKVGQRGRPVTQPCGTVAAYNRHKRNGEPVDAACREAGREHQRKMYLQRKARK